MLNKEKLFDQFPPVSTREWMDKIKSDLKGADFNKRLVWKSDEGFEVNPFYRSEDIDNLPFINTLPGEFPYVRGLKTNNNNWFVRQNIEVSDYREANTKALTIMMKGVDSLGFIISDPESVNRENFELLLHDIHLECVEINFLCNGKAKEILAHLKGIVEDKGIDKSKIRGAIEADPLGRLMVNGKLCVPLEEGLDYLSSLTTLSLTLPGLRTLHLSCSLFNNAGADAVKELAFGLSMGSEYMTQLTDRGIDAHLAASKMRFSFAVASGYFMEIAKLRAARLLWSVIVNGFTNGPSESAKMEIHCVTSEWNKSVYDPYVNLLRSQTEAMSASIGGADSLTVQPFDISFKKGDEFSERIARNQQLILKEESYFDKVADPAAGSYYIENLTWLLADKAWHLFLEIEDQGGFIASLKSGIIQKMIAESAEKRKNDIATRKIVLLGTNQYPNTEETFSGSIDYESNTGDLQYEEELLVEPLIPFRGSKEYDKLRMAVERSDKQPVVSLLPLGNVPLRKARSQFSANFFGCGGYTIIDNPGFNSAGEAVSSALDSQADIVVICSSDEEYASYVPEICEGLKNKAIVVVAGNPSNKDELQSFGVDSFIHLRSNVPEAIMAYNKLLGI